VTIRVELSTAEAEALYSFATYGETEYESGGLPMHRHRFKAGGRGLYKLGAAIRESQGNGDTGPPKVSKFSGVRGATPLKAQPKTRRVGEWELPPGVGPDESMGVG
jgi:hypothetical protein